MRLPGRVFRRARLQVLRWAPGRSARKNITNQNQVHPSMDRNRANFLSKNTNKTSISYITIKNIPYEILTKRRTMLVAIKLHFHLESQEIC